MESLSKHGSETTLWMALLQAWTGVTTRRLKAPKILYKAVRGFNWVAVDTCAR